MSVCISRHGEYGEHIPISDDDFTCVRCGWTDEDGLIAEVATLRTALAERDAAIARVRALHLPDRTDNPRWCVHDGADFGWPCPTILALDAP